MILAMAHGYGEVRYDDDESHERYDLSIPISWLLGSPAPGTEILKRMLAAVHERYILATPLLSVP